MSSPNREMAWRIVKWLHDTPGKKMVVLAGIGHVWKKAIPDQIKARSNYRLAVILPKMPSGKQAAEVTSNDADYLLINNE